MNKLQILVSYYYLRKSTSLFEYICFLAEDKRVEVLIDSGAFSAWKRGEKIIVKEYIGFLKTLPASIKKYFTLDVVGEPVKSKNNYNIILDSDLLPIPIFTRGGSLKEIEEYYNTSEILAIGGLVGTPGNKGYVKYIMPHIKKRKVHWLGFTNLPFISYYRPYMCDSSGWLSGVQFGKLSLYKKNGVFETVRCKDFKGSFSKDFQLLLSRYSLPLKSFHQRKFWTGQSVRKAAAVSHIKYMQEIKKKFNTNYYMAASHEYDFKIIYKSFLQQEKDT